MRSCLIADDHPLLREAMTALIARRWPGARIDGAWDFPSAWRLADTRPDVMLVDLDMPGAEPRAGVAHIMAIAPDTPILIVTATHDDGLMRDLAAAGVAGMVSKNTEAEAIGDAIATILDGGRVLPPQHAVIAGGSPRQARAMPDGRTLRLSPRQIDVVGLVARGLSNKEIARELALSPATVKTHVAQCIAALGALNRTDAAVKARMLGLLP